MSKEYPNGQVKQCALNIEPGVTLFFDTYCWPDLLKAGIFFDCGPNISDPTLQEGDFSISGLGTQGRICFCVSKQTCDPERYSHYYDWYLTMKDHNKAI